jgi:hypothetical protein
VTNWFRNSAESATTSSEAEAYRAGPREERLNIEQDMVGRPLKAEIDAAYERGRQDERARRRGSPVIAILVVIVALMGGGMIYLAIRDGSFGAAGAQVDHTLSSGVDQVQAPIKGAAAKTGDALQAAGKNLKKDAGAETN